MVQDCLVLSEQLTNFGKSTILLEYALGHNKSSRERPAALPSFLLDTQKDVFETSEDIMLEPANGGARNLKAPLNSKIDTAVRRQ